MTAQGPGEEGGGQAARLSKYVMYGNGDMYLLSIKHGVLGRDDDCHVFTRRYDTSIITPYRCQGHLVAWIINGPLIGHFPWKLIRVSYTTAVSYDVNGLFMASSLRSLVLSGQRTTMVPTAHFTGASIRPAPSRQMPSCRSSGPGCRTGCGTRVSRTRCRRAGRGPGSC